MTRHEIEITVDSDQLLLEQVQAHLEALDKSQDGYLLVALDNNPFLTRSTLEPPKLLTTLDSAGMSLAELIMALRDLLAEKLRGKIVVQTGSSTVEIPFSSTSQDVKDALAAIDIDTVTHVTVEQ